MKIVAINAVGLVGETPKGGWTVELKPEDSVHTLIAVHTDGGITGYGSVFTNHLLVAAALRVLEPLYRGEQAPHRLPGGLAQDVPERDVDAADSVGDAAAHPHPEAVLGQLLGHPLGLERQLALP